MIARLRAVPGWFRDDRFRLWVGLATLLALVVRVAWVLWVSRKPDNLFDPARYLGYAEEIAKGHGMMQVDLKALSEGRTPKNYPTAYFPPGYPWFLGIVTWLSKPFTDDVALVAGLVQAALGAATATLGAIVGRRIAGVRAGIAAAFGLALYPNLVFHTGALLSETLYNVLFMAFLALLVWRPWDDGLSTRRIVGSGVLLGLAVMVRPISLAVVPVVVLAWWWHRRAARKTEEAAGEEPSSPLPILRPAVLLVAGVLACVLPWTVRNQVRMHELVPISTNTGDNLCMGHGERATGAFRTIAPDDPCTPDHDPRDGAAAEIAADHEKTSAAIDGTLDHLGREPWLLWRRFFYMWVRDGDHDAVNAVRSYNRSYTFTKPQETALYRIADVGYWLTCAVGVAGLVLLVVRRRQLDLLLLGCTLMTAAVPLAFFGDSRFKVPVIPLLIVAAAGLLGGRRPVEDVIVRDDLL